MAASVYMEQRLVCFQHLRTNTTPRRLLVFAAFKHVTKKVLTASEFLTLKQNYPSPLLHVIIRDKRLLLSQSVPNSMCILFVLGIVGVPVFLPCPQIRPSSWTELRPYTSSPSIFIAVPVGALHHWPNSLSYHIILVTLKQCFVSVLGATTK